VGTEITGYGLNSRVIVVRFPMGARYFFVCSEARTPTMGPSRHLYSQRTEGSSPGGQAAKAWSCPLTPCNAKVSVWRYLQFLSRLHGVYWGFTFSSHTNNFPVLSITITTQATCSVQIIRIAWPSPSYCRSQPHKGPTLDITDSLGQWLPKSSQETNKPGPHSGRETVWPNRQVTATSTL